jgi:hypothetical protein
VPAKDGVVLLRIVNLARGNAKAPAHAASREAIDQLDVVLEEDLLSRRKNVRARRTLLSLTACLQRTAVTRRER